MTEAEQRAINDTLFLLITRDWIKSKQVYSFSTDFLDMLCGIDDFEINESYRWFFKEELF